MPVPLQRDHAATVAALQRWLGRRAGYAGAVVDEVTVPAARGFANETLMVRLRPGSAPLDRLVVRVAPVRHPVYPAARIAEQAAVMAGLWDTDVPVPPVLGHEPGSALLGAPFLVMGHVDGAVAADLPSYHRQGWLAELSPADRARRWEAALDVLHRIHRRPAPGTVHGLLRDLRRDRDFFGCTHRVVTGALDWLDRNVPPAPAAGSLLWGDARLGNLVFAGDRVAAVLDWEMTGGGPPETDLGWFCWMDRFLSTGIGADRLPGLPTAEDTWAGYGDRLGRPLGPMRYYLVLAGARFCLITARVQAMMRATGLITPDRPVPLHDNAIRQLAAVLGGASTPARSALDRTLPSSQEPVRLDKE